MDSLSSVPMRLLSSALLAAASAATLASCVGATDPAAGLAVTATAAHTRVAVGERVGLEVVATNVSGRALRVPGGPPAFLEVRDAGGRVLAFGRFEVTALVAYAPVTLAPGAAVRDAPTWAGELDGGGRAAAGTYRLRGAVPVLAGAGGYAYSPPVVVEVLAR